MSMEIEKFLSLNKENSSTLEVFSEKINLDELKKSICIFGVLESGHPAQELLFDYVFDQFKTFFISFAKKNKKHKIEDVFEETLQNLNQNLTSYIKEKNILTDFECLSGVVAVLVDHDLYFTYLGKINTLLVHKIGKDNYKIIDILDNVSGSAIKPTIFKMFSNVISGQIQDDDALFFSSVNILDKIDTSKIKEFIITNSTADAINKVKELLGYKKNTSFGAILLKLDSRKNPIKVVQEEIENKKEKIKTSGILSNILQKKDSNNNEKSKIIIKAESPKNVENIEEIEDVKKIENIKQVKQAEEVEDIESIKNIDDEVEDVKQVEEIEIEDVKNLQSIHSTKEVDIDSIEDEDSLSSKVGDKINKTKNSFLSLKHISQILLLIIVVSLIFFVKNLTDKKKQNVVIEKEKSYLDSVKKIEDKLISADAKLIIKENEDALAEIREAQNLISQLPIDQETKELKQKADRYLNQIRNINEIIEPKVIVNLANPATHLIKQGKDIYLYNDNNSIYKLNLDSQEVKTVATNLEKDKGSWKKNTPDFEEGKTLMLYNGAGLSQYNFSTNELSDLTISLADKIKIDDLHFYGQKLYILDSANNKIYKHVKTTKNSFSSGSNWVTDDTNLNGSVSVAIDGNVWVLKNNGEIIKLFKGEKVDWQIKTIDPALSSPTKIYTTLEMKNIYILEPSGKRVIVVDKLGNLLGQYYSEKFDNLLDFVLEKNEKGEETGKIYLLNGMKVFEINVKG